MSNINSYFLDHAKQVPVYLQSNDSVRDLYDYTSGAEDAAHVNVITVIPYEHDGSFLALPLEDWAMIEEKAQFPGYFDLSQLLTTFWHSQPVVFLTDIDYKDFDQQVVRDHVRDLSLAYSRDLAAQYCAEHSHYLNQSFDLEKLAQKGVYLQGNCYDIAQLMFSHTILPENTKYFIPLFNIYSHDSNEMLQLLAFDANGHFIDFIVTLV